MTTPIIPMPFKTHDLIGAWQYVSAYTELPDGTTTYNFGTTPKGIFIILENGRYSHIVMKDDLPIVASGTLYVLTDLEAQAMAKGVLAHFGTWTADEKNGTFTVVIENSSFANFDGIHQQRIMLNLTKTTLEYVNLATTNGGSAKVFAVLQRIPDCD
jgi:hypothetical protein